MNEGKMQNHDLLKTEKKKTELQHLEITQGKKPRQREGNRNIRKKI